MELSFTLTARQVDEIKYDACHRSFMTDRSWQSRSSNDPVRLPPNADDNAELVGSYLMRNGSFPEPEMSSPAAEVAYRQLREEIDRKRSSGESHGGLKRPDNRPPGKKTRFGASDRTSSDVKRVGTSAFVTPFEKCGVNPIVLINDEQKATVKVIKKIFESGSRFALLDSRMGAGKSWAAAYFALESSKLAAVAFVHGNVLHTAVGAHVIVVVAHAECSNTDIRLGVVKVVVILHLRCQVHDIAVIGDGEHQVEQLLGDQVHGPTLPLHQGIHCASAVQLETQILF
jgi:hypothetical protein